VKSLCHSGMIIFKQAADIFSFLQKEKEQRKIGFVPTMGALHQGHISLVNLSRQQNDLTVCSIFVNPTQFNNPDDFKHYPVTIEKDIEQLLMAGCDALFLPSVAEIYPNGYQKKVYDLGEIETIFEGKYRPGHFQGVCQVVDRLLEMIDPNRIYLGQKDYQQCMVIRRLINILGKEDQYELVIAPTIREKSGLAMSSRNMRLSSEQRAQAKALFEALTYIKNHISSNNNSIAEAKTSLESKGFAVDYIAVADAATLEIPKPSSNKLVSLVAASINGVRLIDNLLLN
jgi:pantoate--beta-alanine ligase